MAAPILTPNERVLRLTRVFDAPRALVWASWTDPKHAARWWGPRHHPATYLAIDARVGGRWRGRLMGADGRELWQGGVFREVIEPERLVFTFAWDADNGFENLVTITFADEGGRTRMDFRQEPFIAADEREGHGEGWMSSFDRLDEELVVWKGQS